MPELPEVETIARNLQRKIGGKRIAAVAVYWDRTIACPARALFTKKLAGAKITRIDRRAKYLRIELSRNGKQQFMLIHLRMSGVLEIESRNYKPAKHDRVILSFADGKKLVFNDTRKFGRIYLVDDHSRITGKLGPEPLDPELDPDRFYTMLRLKKGAIKPLLLNQAFLVGIGNIYVDESLWRAKIHPLTRANRISKLRVPKLLQAIRQTLSEAIENQGTHIGDGVVAWGRYVPRVYQRDGHGCPRCRTTIKRIVVGQRGTHLCPGCQKR